MTTTHRIAVDATPLAGRMKGAGRFLTNLLRALPSVDAGLGYVVLATSSARKALEDGAPGVEIVEVPHSSGVRWEVLGLGRRARAVGADLVFTVREIVGLGGPPTVMHVFEPPAYRLRSRPPTEALKRRTKDALLAALLRRSVRRASMVTAGSHATADWIRSRYGISPTVIYPGIDPFFFDDGASGAGATTERYVLHPATGDPRENTELVLRAFARARPPRVILRTVGTPDALAERLRASASALGIGETFRVEGWVSDERLRALYAGAIALLHPSRYEGFAGYPSLEAMALGTPVVALRSPGTTEALEGAALLVEGEDPPAFAAAIQRICSDETLRGDLAISGRDRARGLTWERCASDFVSVFRRALDR